MCRHWQHGEPIQKNLEMKSAEIWSRRSETPNRGNLINIRAAQNKCSHRVWDIINFYSARNLLHPRVRWAQLLSRWNWAAEH